MRTSTTHSHGARSTDVPGRSAEDVKIMVNAVQANSKAWHNAMQSEHIQHMAIALAQRPIEKAWRLLELLGDFV